MEIHLQLDVDAVIINSDYQSWTNIYELDWWYVGYGLEFDPTNKSNKRTRGTWRQILLCGYLSGF